MKCLNCGAYTKNKKFCSRKCYTKYRWSSDSTKQNSTQELSLCIVCRKVVKQKTVCSDACQRFLEQGKNSYKLIHSIADQLDNGLKENISREAIISLFSKNGISLNADIQEILAHDVDKALEKEPSTLREETGQNICAICGVKTDAGITCSNLCHYLLEQAGQSAQLLNALNEYFERNFREKILHEISILFADKKNIFITDDTLQTLLCDITAYSSLDIATTTKNSEEDKHIVPDFIVKSFASNPSHDTSAVMFGKENPHSGICMNCGKVTKNRFYCSQKCRSEYSRHKNPTAYATRPCKVCGRETRNQKYCSMKCQRQYQQIQKELCVEPSTHPCLYCGNQTENKLYCSTKCYNLHTKELTESIGVKALTHPCFNCGKETSNNKFCSNQCFTQYMAKKRLSEKQ